MVSKLSEGVKVSVETYYQPDYSNPFRNQYMFAYRITIENHNAFPVQVLKRYWSIFDSNNEFNEVNGEGVVGQCPVVKPGEQFEYVSGCELSTEFGKMSGRYTMENLHTKRTFEVNIPPFEMIVPFKMN